MRELKSNCSHDIKIFLVGNKLELENERVVNKEIAIQLVKDYDLDFFIEFSSKTMNVDKLYVKAAKLLYDDYCKYKIVKTLKSKEIKNEGSHNCMGAKRKGSLKRKETSKEKDKNIENTKKNIYENDSKPNDNIKSITYNNQNEIKEAINAQWSEYYDWKEMIGNGGFGCVFKAVNKKTNELRAIKIINNEFKESFINEVNIMEKFCINNQNSIKIYEKFNSNKEYAIIMELCDCNLKQKLNESPKGFNSTEIKKILSQLNNTFRIMVDNKIIHRDIKLENILVKNKQNDYIVKLTDYGVSKQLKTLAQQYQTNVGTPITMAPEILDEKKYDNKCDLWSIGVIIYQLCFKEPPYKGESSIALSKKIKNLGQKHFKQSDDPKLDDLIRKLLVANPSKRLNWKEYFEHPFFK